MTGLPTGEARWSDATLAAACLAVDPAGLGGAVVRAGVEPARDESLEVMRDFVPRSTPFRRLPLHATEGRLLGGLDLAATLSAGRPVAERGLLAESDGGVLLVPMSERLPASTAALLATTLDTGCVALERDGIAARLPARFALLALDEGESPEESTAASLAERLAFGIDLRGLRTPELLPPAMDADDVRAARARLRTVTVPDETLEALCGAAALLGIGSSRAPLFALRAARALAALDGVEQPTSRHVQVAARLVYASRATCLPATESEPEEQSPPEELPPDASLGTNEDGSTLPDGPLEDRVVAAVSAVLPADVLAGMLAARAARSRHAATGRSGATRASRSRGRPAGVRSGALRPGEHLNLVETLRAAAPWQRLRAHRAAEIRRPRVSVRPDDFRVTRYKHRSPTTTVFVVDASGSSALHRLGEAKGAVELLLADCYVMIGFSAGGLSALLASDAPGVVGYIGLDPFDRPSHVGLDAARRLQVPAYLLRGPSRACNAYSIAEPWVAALPQLREDRVLPDATHCDFESPTDGLCEFVCGDANPVDQAEVRSFILRSVAELTAP